VDDARALRVAYVSESYGPHDHRFLTAAKSVASEVWHVRLDPTAPISDERPTPVGDTRTRIVASGELGERVSALRAAFAEIEPDVVHAGPLQRVTFPVVLATNAPVVAASWGSDLLRAAEEDPVWRDVAAFSLSRAQGFLGDCSAVFDRARELGFRGPHARIPWGVDASQFCPNGATKRFGPEDAFVILSTRNWEEVYDVGTLAGAFSDLEPDVGAHLVLCGSGSEEDRLRSILEEATTGGRVTWVGHVSQAELPALYRGADIYVSTSKCDGSSVSLLEAMSCGRPVLVSDIPGNREWVEATEHRFAVGDAEDLRTSLRRLATTPRAIREASGHPGRARVLQDADWAKAPQKLARLYAEVAV
jgi:glycosyltransferase involved in cell wall biosynthesis